MSAKTDPGSFLVAEFISREEPHIDASAFSPKPISLNFR